MFIYRKIHIENYIKEAIHQEIKNLNIKNCKENFNYFAIDDIKIQCPIFFNWMENKKMVAVKAAVIITDANFYNSIPHIDAQVNSLALNFPIENCEETETIFYKTESPLKIKLLTKPNGVIYKSILNTDWKEIGRYTLDSPVFLNTHVPHKIVNHGQNRRIALSIRFDPDPWECAYE